MKGCRLSMLAQRWICSLVVLLALAGSTNSASVARAADSPRERQLIDDGWKFQLGDLGFQENIINAGVNEGPAGSNFDDTRWRTVNVPHDWAVELPFDQSAAANHGFKPLGPGFSNNSVGWYRRSFTLSPADKGKRLWLEFDGVYRKCQVFLNGYMLTHNEGGYDSFRCEFTDVARYGGKNVLAVRVDASEDEGWFYEGAGIYRHVWLVKTAPLAVAPDGIFVSSQFPNKIPQGPAEIHLEAKLLNSQDQPADAKVSWHISGTVAQAWVSGPVLATLPDFKHDVDALAAFAAAATRITDPNTPTVLYNGKIAPLLPGQLKGIIWYQGESNADRKSQAVQYRTLLPTLVNDWRNQFDAKIPFYIVQLANFRALHDQPDNSDVWPLLREAQLTTSEQLKAPLVVTIDLGDVKNVHYQNKQEVGVRLVKSVLEHTYGKELESSGPALRNARVAGASIVLIFDHAAGLHLKGDADRVFAIAGADKNFVWATPHITENTITLSSAEISAPLYARFAWSDNPLATLYNSDNLPASPFRTSQLDDPGAEDAKAGANLLKQRADVVFDAWNDAFLVRKKGQTYYVRTLKNLGTESEGAWVFALDVEVAEDAYERTRSPEHRQLLNDVLAGFLAQNNYDWTGDTWNDDVAWMTIALVRGYQLTGNKAYLDKAAKGWNMAFKQG